MTGGILEVAGIPGFLGNLDQLYDEADAEGREWRAFTAAWWEEYADTPVSPSDLRMLCIRHGLMGPMLGSGTEQSQKTRLGIALQSARDRVFDGYRLGVVRDSSNKGRLYALQLTKPNGKGDLLSKGPLAGISP